MQVLKQIWQPLERGHAVAKKKFKAEDIKIVWFGTEKPDDIETAENQIRSELFEFMVDGEMELEDLIFHTVFLSKSSDVDVVTVSPLQEKNTVECIYNKNPQWETIDVNDDGEALAIIAHDDRESSTKH